jgi:hypothetical protein
VVLLVLVTDRSGAEPLSGRPARERSGLAAEHSSHVTEQDPPVGGPLDVVAEPATVGVQVGGQTRGERVTMQEGSRTARERPAATLVELPDRSQLGQPRLESVEILVADAAHVRLGSVGRQTDRLELEVLLEPGDAVLAADAALLVPAKRRIGAEPLTAVHRDRPGSDPGRDPEGPVE